jgi:transcriptional regulator with XRE-family HTH domain
MSVQIKGRQVAAARQLAGWTVAELADRVGIVKSTIVNIENTAVQPHKGTIADIVQAFAAAGVEFIEGGVRWTGDLIKVIEGEDAYLRLLDDVYQTLHRKPGSEVLSICTDDAVSPQQVVQAIQRWHDAGIRCRFLTRESATRFDFPLREYRLIPEKFYTNSVMVVFEDKVATLSDASNSVIIVRDLDQADMLRGLFEMIWLQSPSPSPRPPSKARQ